MFEATKKEILRNCTEEVKKEQIKRLEQLTSKRAIASTILWLKSLKKQAEDKNSHKFAETCQHEIQSLTIAYNSYDELEVELRISRQRNADLEGRLIGGNAVTDQLRKVIANYEREFGK